MDTLHRIAEIFPYLLMAYCFVSLDLLMGNRQIPVRIEELPIKAFIPHTGLFVFNAMHFGFYNAPATFQRLMDGILMEHIGMNSGAYLDDLLMSANYQIFRASMYYLAHVIQKRRIAAYQSKLDKIP